MRLKRFKRINKKREIIICLIGIAVLGTLTMSASYSFFQRETEVQFINAKVRFPKASEVTYTTTYNTSVKNVEQALNDLYGKLGK